MGQERVTIQARPDLTRYLRSVCIIASAQSAASMRRLRGAVVAFVLSAGTVCAGVPIAASASAQTVDRLVRHPGIATEVAGFPRLAPSGAPAAAINGGLSAADPRVRTAAAECRAALAASHPGPGRHAWTRRITVAMRGPRYLALLAEDDADCGGPYPNADRFALVYDLQTGHTPNWARLLPSTLVRAVSVETGLDETPIGMVAYSDAKQPVAPGSAA